MAILQISLAEQVGGGHELRDDRYSLDQHTGDNEDSQGHNGDHHQGGDGLLLLAGSHHCQEVCMLTANTHVPRVAAEGEKNVSLLLTEDTGQAPESRGVLCDWRHRCGAVSPLSCPRCCLLRGGETDPLLYQGYTCDH